MDADSPHLIEKSLKPIRSQLEFVEDKQQLRTIPASIDTPLETAQRPGDQSENTTSLVQMQQLPQ